MLSKPARIIYVALTHRVWCVCEKCNRRLRIVFLCFLLSWYLFSNGNQGKPLHTGVSDILILLFSVTLACEICNYKNYNNNKDIVLCSLSGFCKCPAVWPLPVVWRSVIQGFVNLMYWASNGVDKSQKASLIL